MPQPEKKEMVQFTDKNGIRHVREVKPGEDAQEVLSRPTDAQLKQKRIQEEQATLAKIANADDVMAFAHTIKFELKQNGKRFPLEVYEYTKRRMEGEAKPFKHAIRELREDEANSRRPNPEHLKSLNVCPKCHGTYKILHPHLRWCKGELFPAQPPTVA